MKLNRTTLLGVTTVLTGLLLLTEVSQAQSRRARRPPPCPVTLSQLIFPTCSEQPQANGASPAVIAAGTYVGQDPDPRIRAQLRMEFTRGQDVIY